MEYKFYKNTLLQNILQKNFFSKTHFAKELAPLNNKFGIRLSAFFYNDMPYTISRMKYPA